MGIRFTKITLLVSETQIHFLSFAFAFTLRTKYRQEKLRTKIIPDGLSLQMLFKSGDSQEWVKASSESLADKLDSVVVYREEEKKPVVLPTCREIINRKDNYA